MKKLSSDILFYQGLAGLIIGPIIFYFFLKALLADGGPVIVVTIISVLIGCLTLKGCYGVYKARRVSFDDHYIFIENYFSKNTLRISINNVVNIVPGFSLNGKFSGRKPYQISYEYNGKQTTLKFYKSLELYHVNDLESLIGLQHHKSIITNQQNIHDSNSIISTSLKIDRTTRFTSAIMDHIIMTIIAMIFAIPFMIPIFWEKTPPKPEGILFYIMNIGFVLYFCKDCIHGQSIAKRIFKQQIVNEKTGQIANPLRCLIRDLFIIIWPIEVIMLAINPQRRLGDLVAGTKVITYDSELKNQKLNYLQISICFIISYVFMLAILILS